MDYHAYTVTNIESVAYFALTRYLHAVFYRKSFVHEYCYRPKPVLFMGETKPETVIKAVVAPKHQIKNNSIKRTVTFAGISVII